MLEGERSGGRVARSIRGVMVVVVTDSWAASVVAGVRGRLGRISLKRVLRSCIPGELELLRVMAVSSAAYRKAIGGVAWIVCEAAVMALGGSFGGSEIRDNKAP